MHDEETAKLLKRINGLQKKIKKSYEECIFKIHNIREEEKLKEDIDNQDNSHY